MLVIRGNRVKIALPEANPRWRGEHQEQAFFHWDLDGSSPLARGALCEPT
ncbi:Domain of uncharacterised function (DUF2825) [Corynebacterium jeikeium]|nr:Domain of uncharacterised function (DUF2825) [Corynebacterium jeikeium]SUY81483.1 Domain of uncharacterised function (DUF2825) [Corynebacterium jeikeium]SUY85842.1 Domain of uncharacterised function (DUF2825) [Corynebacterium jeikeium]